MGWWKTFRRLQVWISRNDGSISWYFRFIYTALIDRWIDQSMDISIEWLMDWWMDQYMDGWMDGSIKWYMNQWIDGLSIATPPPSSLTPLATTDFTNSNTFLPRKDIVNAACLCFGSVSAVPLVSSSSSEWRSSSAREESSNLAVPIRTTTSCKCRRKRRFVFYAFLWTCWETVKSQALKIVYRAYAGALKGW